MSDLNLAALEIEFEGKKHQKKIVDMNFVGFESLKYEKDRHFVSFRYLASRELLNKAILGLIYIHTETRGEDASEWILDKLLIGYSSNLNQYVLHGEETKGFCSWLFFSGILFGIEYSENNK